MKPWQTSELVAVLDDEPDICALVSLHLKRSGFRVDTFVEPEGFLSALSRRTPDLMILDLMLPDSDGLEICKHLKSHAEFSRVPLIILSAKGEESDRVIGLELGADDYISKPFSVRELVARVKAVLRRSQPAGEKLITVGDLLSIDAAGYEVAVRGRKVELTPTEFRILHLLAAHPGRLFGRDAILNHLWGPEKAVLDRTVDVHIGNLRAKLGEAGRLIVNLRGVGYKLAPRIKRDESGGNKEKK